MATTPSDYAAGGTLATSGRAQFGMASSSAMGMKWSALLDASAIVATLAGLAPAPLTAEIRAFPAAIRSQGGARLDLAEQGIEDMNAIMEPGLSALLAVHARGVNPAAAAQALWQEFCAARDALMALAPQTSATGPMRRT